MKKTALIALALISMSPLALAQKTEGTPPTAVVTLSANTMDIRSALNSICGQARKNYVLEAGVTGVVNLALYEMDFDEALVVFTKAANLKFELQNGIYYFSRAKTEVQKHAATPPKAVEKPKPKGPLPATALQKKITTRLDKTEIRTVFAELTKQTGIEFEITSKVPGYKLDAYLIDTSLRYALDTITKAAGLCYKLTENQTILIDKAQDEVKVTKN
ncbi:MAG: hypothetical protein HZC36_11045 [Armatimonadetes bacterium]|nr:hypothetical protein [Armatimonadota bacterium]